MSSERYTILRGSGSSIGIRTVSTSGPDIEIREDTPLSVSTYQMVRGLISDLGLLCNKAYPMSYHYLKGVCMTNLVMYLTRIPC